MQNSCYYFTTSIVCSKHVSFPYKTGILYKTAVAAVREQNRNLQLKHLQDVLFYPFVSDAEGQQKLG